MAKQLSKFRLVAYPDNYSDLTEKGNVARLTGDIKRIVSTINSEIRIIEIPIPTGLGATFGEGYVKVYWDDVGDDYRNHVDGARIYRADCASDDNTDYYSNNAKEMIVSCVRATSYIDTDIYASTYVYWVTWINLEGVESPVAGGIKGTVGTGSTFVPPASPTVSGVVTATDQTFSGTKSFTNPILAQNVGLSTVVYEDSQQSAIGLRDTGSAVPTLTQYGTTGIYLPMFDVNDLAVFSIQLPHGMAEEATVTIYPHVHWIAESSSANVVRWQLTYQWLNNESDTISATSSTTTCEEAPEEGKVKLTSFNPITKVGAHISSIFAGNIKRVTNGATDYTGNVYLAFFDVHYRKDSLGSNDEGTKSWPT